MTLNRAARACFVLGIVSLVAVLTSHLALTDIYHAEGDVDLEWGVLRVSLGVIVVFQLCALLTLRRIAREGHE
ncbi:MAG TPA: hypothetical protein VJL28_11160 [Gemmatimonadaceae bacterium]|nr:hypothetical protein [Gemmatimonadaceae bacterium]